MLPSKISNDGLNTLKRNLPVLLLFSLILLAGLLTFRQYGESWDENLLQIYAGQSIESYSTWAQKGEVEFEHDNLKHYGPVYAMGVFVLKNFLGIFIQLPEADLRHLVYFLTYFAGVAAFYFIARRWLDELSSAGATLFFVTQPLFWGHAFINPKDIPFLSLFLLSIASGFKMVDSIQKISLDHSDTRFGRRDIVVSVVWLLSVVLLFALTENIHNYISGLVISARAGETNIITFIASKLNQVPADVYIRRYFLLFMRVRAVYFVVSAVLLFFYWRRYQPVLLKMLAAVFLPGILLGLTTSTRVLGPFAGLIVAYYALRAGGKRSIPAIVMYAFIAMTSAYLTWPYLWLDPIGNFFESLTTMSAYPWQGEVLFNGQKYLAVDLPKSYLPVLFSIQLTEPVWLLALIGLGFSLFGASKKPGLLFLSIAWFLVPVAAIFLRDNVLYDNFRQVLFVFPPVFLMAGVVFEKITKPVWKLAVIAACLVPGIVGIFSLHPYEYIYYNSFVAGVGGIQDRFETDYWLTSYREAAEYVNEHASPGAGVWVEGPGQLFAPFARSDLKVNSWSHFEPVEGYEFVVASSRFASNETAHPDAEIIYMVMRDNVVLTVIRKP